MGILSDQLTGTALGLKGIKPGIREHALPTSQLHAQGLNPTGMKNEHSIHDLNGKLPTIREGALATSQLHAQGVNPTTMKSEHSTYDLNGGISEIGKYVDNAPEKGIAGRIVDLTPPN